MAAPIQSKTLKEIRQAIGYNLTDMLIVTASATVTGQGTITAAYSLAKGGDDEYNGQQVICATPAGSISAGEKSWVSDFVGDTDIATVAPIFSAAITLGDVFEFWKVFTYEEINDAINQAIMEVTNDCLQIKEIHNIYTASGEYEYNCLSSFVGLYQVEYVDSVGIEEELEDCDVLWDELVDGDVTATIDTTIEKEGSGCLKLVVAALCGAGDILATEDIASTDLSDCDELEIWIYSTVALTAGDIQVLLDNTAKCASPVESLDVPATVANTWTRHCIALANPQSDSAIISVGLKMVTDKGAFILYADDIKAVKASSRVWKVLNPEQWSITRGATNYLSISENGLSVTGTPTQLRLIGYQLPSLLTTDATTSEIDPAWVIARVTGRLLISHAKSSRLDIKDRGELSKYWLGEAERRKAELITKWAMNTRWV